MRHAALFVLLLSCGTSSSVPTSTREGAGDGTLAPISSAPIGGTVRGRTFTIRSASLRVEPTKKVLSLREYDSVCGVVKGALPPADSLSVHVVLLETGPGETKIVYADEHRATFQIGIDPATVQTIAGTSGRLRFDNFSTTAGDEVRGALELDGEGSSVRGAFTASVCVK